MLLKFSLVPLFLSCFAFAYPNPSQCPQGLEGVWSCHGSSIKIKITSTRLGEEIRSYTMNDETYSLQGGWNLQGVQDHMQYLWWGQNFCLTQKLVMNSRASDRYTGDILPGVTTQSIQMAGHDSLWLRVHGTSLARLCERVAARPETGPGTF